MWSAAPSGLFGLSQALSRTAGHESPTLLPATGGTPCRTQGMPPDEEAWMLEMTVLQDWFNRKRPKVSGRAKRAAGYN